MVSRGLKCIKVGRRSNRRSFIKGLVEHMFLGRYLHYLDSKDRLTIPSRFRESLEEGAYVMQGFDRNLLVFTKSAYEAIASQVKQLNMTDPTARLLRRLIFSTAARAEVDKTGRILLPNFLRLFACLKEEVMVVGAGDYFEIWSPDAWAEQDTKLQDSAANEQRFAALNLSTGI